MIRQLLHLHNLNKNLHKSHQEIKNTQFKLLKNIIKYSYYNIPYYNKTFKKFNINVNSINNFNDIEKIPILTKKTIQSICKSEFISEENKYIIRQTSGSTGIPLEVYIDKRGSIIDEAIWTRALFKNGVKIFDKMAYFPNPHTIPNNIKWYRKIGIMKRKYISVLDTPDDQIEQLNEYKPDIIRSYPSYLVVLSNSNSKKISVNPKMILTTAELLDIATRNKISNTFNSEIFDFYACEEMSLIAFECKEHNGYHINSDNLYLEIVNENASLGTEESGDIVCTTLNNHAMPLIRYKIGDIGKLSENKCTCDINLPILKILEGRTDDFLRTTDGKYVSPRTISDIFHFPSINNKGIYQFQIIQEKSDLITFLLVVDEEYQNKEDIEISISNEIKKFLGNDMNLEFKFVSEIKKDKNKMRKIVSKLNT